MKKHYSIAVLPGDGIGPEVTREALRVLVAAVPDAAHWTIEDYPFGGDAIERCGEPFPKETATACANADAVLLGAVGGDKWNDLELEQRPEFGLLQLRKQLGVFANLRPVEVPDELASQSPLKREVVTGTDLLIVRELTGGIYFGRPSDIDYGPSDPLARDTMVYRKSEIVRVARIAFEHARKRSRRVTSVDKANVLASSRLWRETVTELHANEYSDVALDHLYVDNAAMQLVRAPQDFDVLLTANLFGDILSDLAGVLIGSLGILPSASIGEGAGLFEPIHGSAPTLVGREMANPLGSILSVASLLDRFGEFQSAGVIREAVRSVLASGFRTQDQMAEGCTYASTTRMGSLVAEQCARLLVGVQSKSAPHNQTATPHNQTA